MTDEDPFLSAIDRVERAATDARRVLEDVIDSLDGVRADRRDGLPMSEISDRIVHGVGRRKRYEAAAALQDYERAIMELRAMIIRGMIDDEGLRLTDVARRLAISRQMVSRLYNSLDDQGEPAATATTAATDDERADVNTDRDVTDVPDGDRGSDRAVRPDERPDVSSG